MFLTDAADLPDLDAARLEAAVRVGKLLQVHAREIWSDEEWQMDVTDDAGLILFVLQISAMRTAATQLPHA